MKRVPKDLKWVEKVIWGLNEEGKIKDEEIFSVDLSLRYDQEARHAYLVDLGQVDSE